MKIVKLNRNFTINRNYGFELGLKFDSWGNNAGEIEKELQARYGNSAWGWKFGFSKNIKEHWSNGFGQRDAKTKSTPYWIYLRKASMLTVLRLTLELDKYE